MNQILAVSELNKRAKALLESQLNRVWVEGEVSNFSAPSSGHWYFTLKDDKAQIRCAMFRNRNALIKTRVQSGDQVRVHARVSLYEARGDYQLIADHMEAAGAGALQREFEQLKQRLLNEGLFAAEHKKPLPALVKHLAIVTSATGAALHDMLTVLKRRNAGIDITLVSSAVQGEAAANELISALQKAQAIADVDVIIIGRGGGSIEDLHSFNHEGLARAIFASAVPVVSAVGHETDVTIADFAADFRAATPSAAAELVSTPISSLMQTLDALDQRLYKAINHHIDARQQRVKNAALRIKHPGAKIEQWQQRADFLEQRLITAIKTLVSERQQQLRLNRQTLWQHSPERQLALIKQRLLIANKGLHEQMRQTLQRCHHRFSVAARALHLVSPLATLDRGYSIASTEQKHVVHSVKSMAVGDILNLQLKDGHAKTSVIDIRANPVENALKNPIDTLSGALSSTLSSTTKPNSET